MFILIYVYFEGKENMLPIGKKLWHLNENLSK